MGSRGNMVTYSKIGTAKFKCVGDWAVMFLFAVFVDYNRVNVILHERPWRGTDELFWIKINTSVLLRSWRGLHGLAPRPETGGSQGNSCHVIRFPNFENHRKELT